MKKIKFGFIQGRMTLPPSKKILQFFPKKKWKDEFVLAKKNNFNFIEYIGERKFNKNNPIWNEKGLRKINYLAKKNNLSNYSFCDDYFINHNLNNYKNFEDYVELITKNLSKIKIKIYILALFGQSNIENKNLKKFITRLQYFSDYLRKKNIKLALETNLEVKFIKSLFRLINKKNIYIVYDTGNRLKKKNLQHNEIIKLKKYICHFHLKDKNWKKQNVIMGNGSVDFNSIFKAIKKINYNGRFTFETNRGNNPEKTMRINRNFIFDIIKRLNNKKSFFNA